MYLLGVIPSVLMFENISEQIHYNFPCCMSLVHGNLSRRSILNCFYSTQKEFNQVWLNSVISSAKFLFFLSLSLFLNWSANAWIQLQSLLIRNGSVGLLERGSVKQGSGQPSLSVHERSITPRRCGVGGTFFNLTFILCLDYIRGGFQHT